ANNLHATSGAAALSYATVYPLVMFLRIITPAATRRAVLGTELAGFANNLHATSGAAALSYATVYPLVMFLRIITPAAT
ncbi:hypothetical protein C0U44_31335, partial [Klebsiella pneumoniae]